MSDLLPRIQIPRPEPVTPEEIERRRRVYAAIMQLRREVGQIDVTVEDLLSEDDDE